MSFQRAEIGVHLISGAGHITTGIGGIEQIKIGRQDCYSRIPCETGIYLGAVIIAQFAVIGSLPSAHADLEHDLAIGVVDGMGIGSVLEYGLIAGVERMFVGTGHKVITLAECDLVIIEIIGRTGHGLTIRAAGTAERITSAI